jgi:hypothetical protein
MKIAVMYSGQPRRPDMAIPTHAVYLWHPAIEAGHELHLFGHSTPDHASVAEQCLTVGVATKARLVVEPDPDLPEHDYANRLGRGARNIQGCLRQMHALRSLFQSIENPEQYDLMLRIRYDLEILEPTQPICGYARHCITLPTFHNFGVTRFGGYNDSFAAGPPDAMRAYMTRFNSFDQYYALGFPFHMETFLKWAIDGAGVAVARCDIVFAKVRSDGERDYPFWHPAMGDIPPVEMTR